MNVDSDKVPGQEHNYTQVVEQLQTVRSKSDYDNEGVWSDSRIETASKGILLLQKLRSEASLPLRSYLLTPHVAQVFTGVTPTLGLSRTDSKLQKTLIASWDKNKLFSQIEEELEQLLHTYADDSVRLETVNQSSVRDSYSTSQQLMNESAISNVVEENQDLFPNDIQGSTIDWLLKHSDAWPMTPMSRSEDSKLAEIRSGVLSGYPRSASHKYAEMSTSGINLVKTFLNRGVAVRNIEHETLSDHATEPSMQAAGLQYAHYTAEDLRWTNEAAALMFSASLFQ